MKQNLIEAFIVKKKGDSIAIPDELSMKFSSDRVLEVYVDSKKKIEISAITIKDKTKVIDVLIRVNKGYANQAFKSITDMFKASERFSVVWTTGFCIPDQELVSNSRKKAFDGCLWESLIEAPDNVDIVAIKEMIMKINLEYDDRVIDSVTVSEVRIGE